MPAGNVKRGFNRLFINATIAWVLYCNVIFPLQRKAEEFARANGIYTAEIQNCAERGIRGRLKPEDVPICQKAAENNFDSRNRQASFRNTYALLWPFILAASVGLPLVVYGAIQGIVAVCLWVWRGYKQT